MRPWFCVQSLPRQEDYARQQLERQGYTTFLASYLIKKRDRHIAVRNLFPGYFFISFENTSLWPRVNSTPGVQRILVSPRSNADGSPADYLQPSTNNLSFSIESLRQQALSYDEIRREGRVKEPPKLCITAGCHVRVLQGVFKDEPYAQRALVEWADNERALLMMHMFKREVKVEFYHRDLALVVDEPAKVVV